MIAKPVNMTRCLNVLMNSLNGYTQIRIQTRLLRPSQPTVGQPGRS
jgi:hypothetical protein